MNDVDRPSPLPLPTIRRYPAYLRLIRERMAAGDEEISSAALAAALGIDPVLARKDIAMMGIPGRPRWGYPARDLVEAIQRAALWGMPLSATAGLPSNTSPSWWRSMPIRRFRGRRSMA